MGFRGSSCLLEMPPYHWHLSHALENHEHHDEELANSNHIVISYERFGYHCDVHQRVRNGMPLQHSTSNILAHNAE